MKFFFDEAGNFNPKTGGKLSLCVGIAVPDSVELAFEHGFANFVKCLDKSELKQGEPKGYLLTINSRRTFCMLLNSFIKRVCVYPQIMLYSKIYDKDLENLRRDLYDFFKEYSKTFKYKTMQESVLLLGKQVKNMHESQILRMITLVYCIFITLQHSIIFLTSGENRDSFNKVDLVIDPVNKQKDSRENISFLPLLKGWTLAWSQKNPIVLVEEIHTRNHPFVKKYERPDNKVDFTDIIKNGICYSDSKTSWGLQVADIAANSLKLALEDACCNGSNLEFYGRIMQNSTLGDKIAPGFITISESNSRSTGKEWDILAKVRKEYSSKN